MPAATAEAFRTKVKAVELEAERLQQQAMYDLETPVPCGTDVGSPAESARANVAAYEAMLAVSFANPTVEALLAAFTALPLKAD
jgi:hypothetical protein